MPLEIITCPVPAVADTGSVVTQWGHQTKPMNYGRYVMPADHSSVLTTLTVVIFISEAQLSSPK